MAALLLLLACDPANDSARVPEHAHDGPTLHQVEIPCENNAVTQETEGTILAWGAEFCEGSGCFPWEQDGTTYLNKTDAAISVTCPVGDGSSYATIWWFE